MIIYILNSILNLVLINISKKIKKVNGIYYLLVFIAFISSWFIMSYRLVGADRITYTSHYINMSNVSRFSDYNNYYGFEFGYNILVFFLTRISNNEIFLFLVTSTFTLISIYRFCFKYSKNPDIAIFIYLTFGYYFISFALVRQFIALSIILYGIDYVIKGKKYKYFLVVLVAMLFHSTSIFAIIIYFYKKDININRKIILILISMIISLSFIEYLNQIIKFFDYIFNLNYSNYIGSKYIMRGSNIIHVIVQLAIYLGIYLGYKYLAVNKKELDIIDYISYNSIFISVLIIIFSYKIDLISRIIYYFSIFNIIGISNIIEVFNRNSKLLIKVVIISTMLVYMYLLLTLKSTNIVIPYENYFF